MLNLLAEFGGEPTITLLIDSVVNIPADQSDVRLDFLLAIERVAGISRWPQLSASIDDQVVQQMISQRLVKLLDDDQLATRQAASKAISLSFDCSAVDALIDRVASQPSGNRESWFALFACRCQAANEFLSNASENPRLLGQFNNARLQWSLLPGN